MKLKRGHASGVIARNCIRRHPIIKDLLKKDFIMQILAFNMLSI